MTQKQQNFSDWLFANADVVPVTARPITGLQRVQLKFEHGAICSFGGSILQFNGHMDQEWHSLQAEQLAKVKTLLIDMTDILAESAKGLGNVRTYTVEENGLQLYSYIKRATPNRRANFLKEVVDQIPSHVKDLFYMHLNGNNLAIIPKTITKQNVTFDFYLKNMIQTLNVLF